MAHALFAADRLALAEAFARWLADAGVERGLIGPREVPRLWDRHLLNCAMLGEAIDQEATVVDLGSGAGLPGLVLAIARPDLRITLVEPLERRTTFLHEVVADLGLTGVEVIRGRAESLHGQRTFDVVTSRALAPLSRLLGWSMPLVAPQGSLLAMKGRAAEEEIEAARSQLRHWGCAEPQVLVLGSALFSTGLSTRLSTGLSRGEATPTLSTTRAVRVAHADPGRVALPGRAGGTSTTRTTKKRGRQR
ncbi:16S rRNA (guanine(527)-N(7))-methyltransferase RsmG [Nocardioides sp.]|uniref:16S rRNA (guanine(527)-N(7))-methyltransferase RsmG n=1 Tax=Nocardioides sp. TaxID=35761 RepID=UPI003569BFE4